MTKKSYFYVIALLLLLIFPTNIKANGINGYYNGIFYVNSQPANWWFDDGNDWFFFQNGKKFTGVANDTNGEKCFYNGKYIDGYLEDFFFVNGEFANWWVDDGNDWFFFKKGAKFTGIAKDSNGEKYFINGKYANTYVNDVFYVDGEIANWWAFDGNAWFFFQNGKKFTGLAKDSNGEKYFINGKYANTYINDVFYADGEIANWWAFDGNAWFFFQNGKKFTGLAKDSSGEKYFIKGKYANTYVNDVFYADGEIANWWFDDGNDWFFFQNGKKFTGLAKDSSGEKYFINGKYGDGFFNNKLYKDGSLSNGKVYFNGTFYNENSEPANWWYYDGNAWFFFQNGKKFTGIAKDSSGEKYFINGKYANTYVNDVFYTDGEIANWWFNDGNAWFFFQNGKKFTGIAKDSSGEKYFVNGKYANGKYANKLYKDGIETNGNVYINNYFYDSEKELANWWSFDGNAWFFFQNGKKFTGSAKDSSGEKYFVNGKYANTYINNIFYLEGEIANWWAFDGNAWFFFQNGKKFTGTAKDSSGEKYFIDGKYANGKYDDKLYKDGIETEGNIYINGYFYTTEKELANWWFDDGTAWFFFQNGKKFTGTAKDSSGEKYFIDGKYANGKINGVYYKEGIKYEIPTSYKITTGIHIPNFNLYPYKTGCWLLSAVSGLNNKGAYINPDQLYNALPKTGNPFTGVMGNPRSSGYTANNSYASCFPSALVPIMKQWLPGVENFTGASIDDIKYEISQGNPVQIWLNYGNMFYSSAVGGYLSSDYHSVLLTGYDNNGFFHIEATKHTAYRSLPYFNGSPYYSSRTFNFSDIYGSFGKKAIVYR